MFDWSRFRKLLGYHVAGFGVIFCCLLLSGQTVQAVAVWAVFGAVGLLGLRFVVGLAQWLFGPH